MAEALAATSVLARLDVLWRDVAGELVILDQQGEKILGLNRSGATMWELLDGARTLEDVASEISERYRIDSARALADVREFARTLLDKKLVRLVG